MFEMGAETQPPVNDGEGGLSIAQSVEISHCSVAY